MNAIIGERPHRLEPILARMTVGDSTLLKTERITFDSKSGQVLVAQWPAFGSESK